MAAMVSSGSERRIRKRPEERREEILGAAAAIALAEGLERVTLRAVADRLGVRPGLITHYFPAAEDLVAAAFARAAAGEREQLFARDGDPLSRLQRFVDVIGGDQSRDLSRLWLNARHLSRFSPVLDAAVVEQEALNDEGIVALIEDGVAAGVFTADDPLRAGVRILMAVDGQSAYVNNTRESGGAVYRDFVAETAEWSLGLPPGTLTSARLD
ncbi:TetR family transcriptional regulator [Microbacterium jejuense]|uniref:TetR family transcriptional regulator n=2 Tax=Microbacterium jejuense TaxID=1263637 RepID=A0ABS7HL13_9MICO|nr:TetR family transcriptional regulator [Microbacterium jejuense]